MTSWSVDGSSAPIRVFINGNEIGRAKSVEVEVHTDVEETEDFGYVSAKSVMSSFDVNLDMEGVDVSVTRVDSRKRGGARPAIVIEDEVTAWADPDADPISDVLRTAGDVLRSARGWGKSAPAAATHPTVSVPPAGSHSSSTFGSWFGPSSGGASSGSLWHASDPEPEPETLGDLMSELIIDKARLIWVDDPGEWQLELALRHIDNGTIVTVEVPFNSPLVINDLVDALETYAEETDDD